MSATLRKKRSQQQRRWDILYSKLVFQILIHHSEKGNHNMNNNAKNHEPVRRLAASIRTVVFLSLATNVYDIYRFINQPEGVREGLGIALGILGTILIWQFGKELRAEKKQALVYWLAAGMAGMIRWVFIDATFTFNLLSVFILALSLVFTLRITLWTRNGLLT